MLQETLKLLTSNSFFRTLIIGVMLDTILGLLRAAKDRELNSSFGIDGGIRKVAMLASVGFLMLVDVVMHVNILFMVPEQYITVLGIKKLGICELFCLLFILYEALSILKNMTLCGLPVPKKMKEHIKEALSDMTDEMPQESKEE